MVEYQSTLGLFKLIIIVQIFYALAITIFIYTIPPDAREQVDPFQISNTDVDLQAVGSELQTSINRQVNLPIIDFGALLYYSGNILIDLLLNFVFAIPEMMALFINGFLLLFSIDTYLVNIFELALFVVTIAIYIIGLIQILTTIRSGNPVV